MSIPAVNCTTIKPQVSFGNADSDEERLYNYSKVAEEVNDNHRNSQNVKKPVAAAVSVVLAGLIARGKTKIENIEYILRGYENLDQKLEDLGAKIILKEGE